MVDRFKSQSGPLPASSPVAAPTGTSAAASVATPPPPPAAGAPAATPGGLTADGVSYTRPNGQRGSGPLPEIQPHPEVEAQIPVMPLPRIQPTKGPHKTRIIGKIRSRVRVDAAGNVDAFDALAELGVIGSLAEVALAYGGTTFDPQEIASSLGRFMEHLEHVSEQAESMPFVGELLMGLGGVATIVGGVRSFQKGIAQAKDAQDTPEKVQASLGAAAGAAKIVGGLATALAVLCPPLGAVGAMITAAGVAMDAGRLALEHRSTLGDAMAAFKAKLAALVPDAVRDAVGQTVKLVSDYGSGMMETPA